MSDEINPPYCGVTIITETVYDLLGWLLSVMSTPGRLSANTKSETEYCLLLLSVYAKWELRIAAECTAGAKSAKDARAAQEIFLPGTYPQMVSIAYFNLDRAEATSGNKLVLLGSTMGDFKETASHVVPIRQKMMQDLYFVPDNVNQLGDAKRNSPGQPGFGKCAETNFWLFARQCVHIHQVEGCSFELTFDRYRTASLTQNTMGFALRPSVLNQTEPNAPYKPQPSLAAMADPCESCAWIYHQLVRRLSIQAAGPQLEQFVLMKQSYYKQVLPPPNERFEWYPAFSVGRVRQLVDPTLSWQQFIPSAIDESHQTLRAATALKAAKALRGTQVASPLAQILLPGAVQAATSMLGHAVGYTNTATNAAPKPASQR